MHRIAVTSYQQFIHSTEAGEEGFTYPFACRLRYFRRIPASRMFVPYVNGGKGIELAPVTVAHKIGRHSEFKVAL